MEQQGTLEAQIEVLLNVEKQMRLAGDVVGTKKAVGEILQLCFEARTWKTLNDMIVLLSKHRGQLKQAVMAMVQQAMQYIDQTPDLDTRIELIKTLNSVIARKIHVEIERTSLIKRLAKIKQELRSCSFGARDSSHYREPHILSACTNFSNNILISILSIYCTAG